MIVWRNLCILAANLLQLVIRVRQNLFLLKFSYLSKELCPQNLLCSSHFLLVHAAGGVLCVLCHPFEASYAHAAMQEDTLTCFHHVYHASIREKPASANFQEVTCTPSGISCLNMPPPFFFPLFKVTEEVMHKSLCHAFFLNRLYSCLCVALLLIRNTSPSHTSRSCPTTSGPLTTQGTGGCGHIALQGT